jgi:hypothetical protein
VKIVLNPRGLQDVKVESWGQEEQLPAEGLLILRSKLEEAFRFDSGRRWITSGEEPRERSSSIVGQPLS